MYAQNLVFSWSDYSIFYINGNQKQIISHRKKSERLIATNQKIIIIMWMNVRSYSNLKYIHSPRSRQSLKIPGVIDHYSNWRYSSSVYRYITYSYSSSNSSWDHCKDQKVVGVPPFINTVVVNRCNWRSLCIPIHII